MINFVNVLGLILVTISAYFMFAILAGVTFMVPEYYSDFYSGLSPIWLIGLGIFFLAGMIAFVCNIRLIKKGN